MFFSNKEDKLQLKAINQNYAVIKFNLNGTVKEANKIFLDIMGYSLNEIVGKHHRMFCDKNYVNTNDYISFWNDLSNGISQINEFERVKKDGSSVWIQADRKSTRLNSSHSRASRMPSSA